ncbi:GEVED domain-containing protein [uncultured Winogradskyella sp.]|uniref:GEVED domain-containing protein n=1 Tax=uncultured Winogradskyella sp. TaxID=395353 RepID=UPI00262313AB|nr:GEVED domain-containing protein [uncultured Winogradskyella sp.]
MKKITLLCFVMLAFCWQGYAQLVSDDTCTTSFTDISGTGTDLALADDGEANITLSFAFELDGVSSSDLRVGNNGGVLFNATTGDVGTGSSPTAQGFYPLATDIGGGPGAVYWEETGVAPNRILVVQWNDRPHYDSAAFDVTPGGGTFQLLLYETTNEIRFIYEDLIFDDPTYDNGVTAGVHVIGANGTYTYSLESSLAGVSCVEWNAPSCPFPSNLTATSITSDSAVLGWTETGSATSWNIEVVDVDANPPGSSTGVPTQSGVTNPYMQMSLTSNTAYEFYVQAVCGGDTSQWVGPFAFATECLSFTPDYSADMSVNVPDCWEQAGSGTPATGPSDLGESLWVASNHDGTPSNRINLFFDNREDWIISPVFDLSAAAASELVVYVALTEAATSGSGADLGSDDLVALLMTTDGGANWTTMQSWVQGNVPTDVGEQIIYDLSAVTGDVQFAFYGSDGPVNDAEDIYFHVSQFTVRESPTNAPDCPANVVGTPDAGCGNFANDISWMASTGADGYNITIGTTSGGNDIEDNTDLGDVTSYSFEGSANTTYYYTVTAYNGFGSSTGCTEQDFTTAVDPCYCIPPSTSTNTTTLIDDVTTTGAISNLSNTGTGLSTDRYGDFTATNSVTSFADGTFDFSVEIEGGTVGCAIWVDWNNDFTFDPATEVVFTTTAYGNGPFTGTIAVPNATPNGDYTMRIMIDWNDPGPDDDACAYEAERGETEDYTLTVTDAPADALDFYNLQFPGTATITTGDSQLVYAQAYEAGLTDQGSATASPGIEVWIGYSDMDTDPSGAGWTWVTAVPNPGYDFTNNNNDEYQLDLGAEIVLPGTYYYASRFRLNGATFTYGGFDSGGGDGDWDGTNDVNGVLTIDPIANDDCAGAITVTLGVGTCGPDVTGNNTTATDSGVAQAACATATYSGGDLWYTFTLGAMDTQVDYTRSASAFSTTQVELYSGTCGALVEVDCTTSASASFTGLTGGTTYYMRVYDWGNDNFGDVTFCLGTPPACFEPTGLDASFAPPTSATLSWVAPTSGPAPTGYNWEVVPAGNGQGVGVVSSGSTANLTDTATGLTADTLYDLYVQSDCGGGDLSAWAGPFTFNAGHCIPSGTSTSTFIDNFSTSNADGMNISNLASGLSATNYGNNYDTMTVSGAADGSFDFNVEIVSGTVGCAVWVDWNNDFVFDVSEVSFSTTAYGNGPFTGTVTIPNGTPNGDYRMRVMIDWNDPEPGDDDACGFGSGRGEVEDYKVTVDSTLSNPDLEDASAFTYFPNPVKNTLTLNAQNTIENVTMYNMLGQEVLRATPNNVDSELDMSSLQGGTYFVKVTIANITKTIRVIKQ